MIIGHVVKLDPTPRQQRALLSHIAVAVVDRWFPSTKTCSRCGHVHTMPLSVRVYSCPECEFECDRDVNAAINLLAVAGSAPETQNACGETVSRSLVTFIGKPPHVSMKQESGIRRYSSV